MTLGQVVSNVLSGALVAGWVGLRAYEMWHYYNREQEEGAQSADDELAFLQQQQAERRRSRASGPIIFTYSSAHGTQVFHGAHPDTDTMGGADNPLGVDLLNLQLGLIDRDFDDSDYEMLLALDRDNHGRGAPVSEEQLAALPQHSYHSATAATAERGSSGQDSSAYHQALQARYGGDNSSGSSGTAAAHSSGERGSGSSASAEADAPTCSICLEQFKDGAQVSALPCFHTYHRGCLEPWLRQQGRSSTCPICKTPVFEQR